MVACSGIVATKSGQCPTQMSGECGLASLLLLCLCPSKNFVYGMCLQTYMFRYTFMENAPKRREGETHTKRRRRKHRPNGGGKETAPPTKGEVESSTTPKSEAAPTKGEGKTATTPPRRNDIRSDFLQCTKARSPSPPSSPTQLVKSECQDSCGLTKIEALKCMIPTALTRDMGTNGLDSTLGSGF